MNATIKSPVFVLCSARSGSTLLRFILDSHREFCCPKELHLALLARHLIWTYIITTGHEPADRDEAGQSIIGIRVRNDLDRIMGEYAAQQGKTAWCEKSISTIDNVESILLAYPRARFICLYRNCLDQAASALETLEHSPDAEGYGYAPYLQANPDNPTDAVVSYWCDKTSAIMAFQQRNPGRSIAIRYEDIVLDTDTQLENLFTWLGSDWNSSMMDAVFAKKRTAGGGDHKILDTDRILVNSVGRGASIDIRKISSAHQSMASRLHEALAYNALPDS